MRFREKFQQGLDANGYMRMVGIEVWRRDRNECFFWEKGDSVDNEYMSRDADITALRIAGLPYLS